MTNIKAQTAEKFTAASEGILVGALQAIRDHIYTPDDGMTYMMPGHVPLTDYVNDVINRAGHSELLPWCPGNCGCILGTNDADRRECGCDEGCGEKWG